MSLPRESPNCLLMQVAYVKRGPGGSPRLYGYRWARYRAKFLRKAENVLCRQCRARGLLVPATVVDHIQPARLRPDLFWDPANHAPMCASCHSEKSAREQANYRTGKPVVAKGCDERGEPIDKVNHPWYARGRG
jgi:5-methylcytosine-specific restriction endonuclease McrA